MSDFRFNLFLFESERKEQERGKNAWSQEEMFSSSTVKVGTAGYIIGNIFPQQEEIKGRGEEETFGYNNPTVQVSTPCIKNEVIQFMKHSFNFL
jgi:hypothetical protein